MFALITGLKWHLLGCSGTNHYFSLCNPSLSFKHIHLVLLCKQYILRISVHCFLEKESCHTSKENSLLLFFYLPEFASRIAALPISFCVNSGKLSFDFLNSYRGTLIYPPCQDVVKFKMICKICQPLTLSAQND